MNGSWTLKEFCKILLNHITAIMSIWKFNFLDFNLLVCTITHMNSKKIITFLKKKGWVHIRTTGDHWHFRHPEKAGIVTVPHPKKDIPVGTLKSIEKQANMKFK